MKICIVENEAPVAERLKGYIEKFAKEKEIFLESAVFSNAVDFLTDYPSKVDAVFMDIEMPMMDGMTACEKLRERDKNVQIVFVTNMAQYAIKGYKVHALDFLVKPVDYFDIQLVMEKIITLMPSNAEEFLYVNANDGMRRVSFSEIRYVEVYGHNVCLHTRDENIVFRGTLKDIESQADKNLFARCNNCYLVNMYYVIKLKGDQLYLEGGDVLHVSRTRKKQFLNSLTNYINRVGGNL